MFERDDTPRAFALEPGVDVADAIVEGLRARLPKGDTTAIARTTIWVNTRRLERRLVEVLSVGPATLLPKIRPIAEFGSELLEGSSSSALRQRLELAALLRPVMEADPAMGPPASAFALASTLVTLFAEMQDEGVGGDVLGGLDVADHARHWSRNLKVVRIAQDYFDALDLKTAAQRQRRAAEAQIEDWRADPPSDPVLIAGSTGSRGTTAMIMEAVARLPQGAVLLPGFDPELPLSVVESLTRSRALEDHPQQRLAAMVSRLGLAWDQVVPWAGKAPDPKRNTFLSLALRPAPVTDAWLREGPRLGPPAEATRNVKLIEAASPREEALSIALELRAAAEDRKSAALISPDRVLARQVSAMLERWGILPDDSAGRPLSLTPPGRFLALAAGLLVRTPKAVDMIALFKHPLCNSAPGARGEHSLWLQAVEIAVRRKMLAVPSQAVLRASSGNEVWANWFGDAISVSAPPPAPLSVWARRLGDLAEGLAAGPESRIDHVLWAEEAGEAAKDLLEGMRGEEAAGGPITGVEFLSIFSSLLAEESVREAVQTHPRITIWGTLEARVQSADLVVLGGLNEGVWPAPPAADPWLNRTLRKEAGLTLPERRIGLQAHDFQLAASAASVTFSRAVHDGEAATVPARWLNRFVNLLGGLGSNGADALDAMRNRGTTRLQQAQFLDDERISSPRAARPKPCPPVAARPRSFSVTQIQTLIRDPYAIYARKVLELDPIDPFDPEPDARLRGILVHDILKRFIQGDDLRPERLVEIAKDVLAEVPEAEMAALWSTMLAEQSKAFVDAELARQSSARPVALEVKGTYEIPALGVTITCTADRIDRTERGDLVIYDYKTGAPPGAKVMKHFDRQLLIEAVMAEEGGFADVPPARVSSVVHLKVGRSLASRATALVEGRGTDFRTQTVARELAALIAAYLSEDQGYLSRRALQSEHDERDYDHLARYGEWDETDEADP